MKYPYEDLYTASTDYAYDSARDAECDFDHYHDCCECGQYAGECKTDFWKCETRKTDLCAKCKAKAATAV